MMLMLVSPFLFYAVPKCQIPFYCKYSIFIILDFSGGLFPSNGRGVRGRKKGDGALSAVTSGFGTGNLSELAVLGQDSSPPRITEDTAESDSSSVASSLERLNEDFTLFPEQWFEQFPH
jgi:hypothetical protein